MLQRAKVSSRFMQTLSAIIQQNSDTPAPAKRSDSTLTSSTYTTVEPDTTRLQSTTTSTSPVPTGTPPEPPPPPRRHQLTPDRNAGATFVKPDEPMNHHRPSSGVFSNSVPLERHIALDL